MKLTAGRTSLAAIAATLLLFLVFSVTQRYLGGDGQAWRTVISSDGEGYYAYLTGLFVDGGLTHANAAEYHFAPAGEGRVIKYFCGTALVQAPFFLLAHAWCSLTGVEADGRTLPYQIAVGLCSVCLLLFGLMQLRALLRSLGLADGAVAFALSVLVLGTGLIYQAVMAPSMSHVASFAMVAWALHEARRAWFEVDRSALARVAVAIALVVLVRPVNVIAIVALPLACMDHPGSAMAWLKRQGVRRLTPAILLFLSIVLLQPLLWYVQCGRFFVVPYAGEGFYWDRPMLFQVLFSARKGLFFYWPLLLLALPGILVMWRRSRIAACSLVVAIAAVAYVASCWWTWYYGHSYGMRPLLDHLALFAIPIAFLHHALPFRGRVLLVSCSVPVMALQCFQVWQYQTGILHPFNMDLEKYRMIFLRTGDAHRHLFGEGCASPPYAPRGFEILADTLPVPASGALGAGTWHLDSIARFGPAMVLGPERIPAGNVLYVEVSSRRKAIDMGASNTAEIVCTLGQDGSNWYYNNYRLNDILLPDDRSWRPWRHAFYVPAAHPGDEMRVYIVQNGVGRLLLHNVHVRIRAVRGGTASN